MSNYAQARQVYALEHCVRTFDDDLRLHLHHGFVFSTPDFFVMGRHVPKAAPAGQIVDPRVVFEAADCDCWHVYLASGDLSKAWGVLPWPLPWVSFERKNELRFYPADRIKEHCLP